MRLNPDCVRDILLAVESNEFGQHMTFDQLCDKLTNYSREDIHYCCLKLSEAGLLEIISRSTLRQSMPSIKTIKDLTFEGHEFLEDIKSDNTWNKTKAVAKNIGTFSIHALKEISVSVISELIKNNL